MSDIWNSNLFLIAIYFFAVVLFVLIIGWALDHIASGIVEIVKDAVKESGRNEDEE